MAILPDHVDVHRFPSGYPATKGTLELLAEHVIADSRKPRLRARVRELFKRLPSLDVDGEIRAVWDFVLGHVRYMKDVLGTEHLTYPEELDKEVDDGTAAEDCESIAGYAAALLAAAGIESRFVIIGRNPARPLEFRHCYLEVENYRTGQWYAFDTVGALEFGLPLGQAVQWPGPIERWSLEGRKETMALDLRGCLCKNGDERTLRGAVLGDTWDDFKKGWEEVHELVRPIAEGAADYFPVAKPFVKAADTIEAGITGREPLSQAAADLKKMVASAGGVTKPAPSTKPYQLPPPPFGGARKKPSTAAPASTAEKIVGASIIGLGLKALLF